MCGHGCYCFVWLYATAVKWYSVWVPSCVQFYTQAKTVTAKWTLDDKTCHTTKPTTERQRLPGLDRVGAQ